MGSSFESFLKESGIKDDVEVRAQKELLAEQIREAMGRKGMSFSALASLVRTSRTVVYRLLDPADTGVTLDTLSRVARALGLGLKVSLAHPRAPASARRGEVQGTDLLAEIVDERTRQNPAFPNLVAEAEARRKVARIAPKGQRAARGRRDRVR